MKSGVPITSESSNWTVYLLFRMVQVGFYLVAIFVTAGVGFAQGCTPATSGDPRHPFSAALWNSTVSQHSYADCDTVLIADPSTNLPRSDRKSVV